MRKRECGGCRKTFTSLTGTPFSRVHHKAKLLKNAACMKDLLSVRDAADRMGVHRNTAFRYRHLMMPLLEKHQPDELLGVAEADEAFFRRSYKGQKRGMPRTAHKRGTPASKRGISREQVAVLTAIARGSRNSFIAVFLPFQALQRWAPPWGQCWSTIWFSSPTRRAPTRRLRKLWVSWSGEFPGAHTGSGRITSRT